MQSEILTQINGIAIYQRNIAMLPKNKALQSRARALRKAGVLSEVIFWLQVKNNLFHHIDFDRQRIIGNYIVDFYVKKLGLIIEIDGSSHNNKQEYDARREKYLVSLGLVMYRISDTRVKYDLNTIMQELEVFICDEFSE